MANSSHADWREKLSFVVVVDVASVRELWQFVDILCYYLLRPLSRVWVVRDRLSIISRHIVFTAANIDPNLDGQVLTFDVERRLSIDP